MSRLKHAILAILLSLSVTQLYAAPKEAVVTDTNGGQTTLTRQGNSPATAPIKDVVVTDDNGAKTVLDHASDVQAVPAAPTTLVASPGERTATVTWQVNSANVTGFLLEDTGPDGQTSPRPILPADARSETLVSLKPGRHTFSVRSVGTAGSSDKASCSADVQDITPPPPVTNAVVVQPGRWPTFQNDKVYVLEPGDYTPTDVTSSRAKVTSRVQFGAVVRIAKGKQLKVVGAQNQFDGIVFSGGSLGKDNQNAATYVKGPSNVFRNCVVEKSDFVGISFDGDDSIWDGGIFRDCGMAGAGGKGKRIKVKNFVATNNNTSKQRDGATLGKFTRTVDTWIGPGKIQGGYFAGVWFDINNTNFTVSQVEITGVQKAREEYEGVGIKTEIGGPNGTVTECKIHDNYGPAVVVNETRGVKITKNLLGNGTGPFGAVLSIRNMRRSDEKTNALHNGDWQVKDLTFTNNEFIGGTGLVTGSPATNDTLDQKADNLVLQPNVGTVKIKDWK